MKTNKFRCFPPISFRYHFAALKGVFYERFPYRNHVVLKEKSLHVSRFISLAPFGNKIKHKVNIF